MKHSMIYMFSKRGDKGRKATRFLDDARVAEAKTRASNPKHQEKFMSTHKRLAMQLKKTLNLS